MEDHERTKALVILLREQWRLLPPGSRLPSDRELAQRHGVGRGVLAGVMGSLQRQGLVRRLRGAGTYWLGEGQSLVHSVPSFSQWARTAGGTLGWHLVAQEADRVAALEREYLRLPKNATVWRIRRVFTLDGVPAGFATSVIPVRDTPALPVELELYGSIFQTFTRRYRMDVAREWFRRRSADPPGVALLALGIRPSMPSGPVPFDLEESVNRAADGAPVEYSRTFARCDVLQPYARFRTPAR